MKAAADSLIFDLDGTIIDSGPDILRCFNRAVRQVLAPKRCRSARKYIGLSVKDMAKALYPSASDSQVAEVVRLFRECYDSGKYPGTNVFPGAKRVLNQLAAGGIKLFLVTNKPWSATEKILRQFGLDLFEEVICPRAGGVLQSKAEMVRGLIAGRGLVKSRTLMIGDAAPDVQAAVLNKVGVILMRHGYGLATVPDRSVKRLRDFAELGRHILAGRVLPKKAHL